MGSFLVFMGGWTALLIWVIGQIALNFFAYILGKRIYILQLLGCLLIIPAFGFVIDQIFMTNFYVKYSIMWSVINFIVESIRNIIAGKDIKQIDALIEGEHWDSVINECNRVMHRHSYHAKNTVTLLSYRAHAYLMDSEFDSALADYTTAIKLASNNTFLYFGRGEVHVKLENYDKAIEDLNKATSLFPPSGDGDIPGRFNYNKFPFCFFRSCWRKLEYRRIEIFNLKYYYHYDIGLLTFYCYNKKGNKNKAENLSKFIKSNEQNDSFIENRFKNFCLARMHLKAFSREGLRQSIKSSMEVYYDRPVYYMEHL